MSDYEEGRENKGNLLKKVCVFGLVIAAILIALLVFISRYGNIPLFSSLRSASFSRALAEYDLDLAAGILSQKQILKTLDGLEKKALDIENELSVLKRRRALALGKTPEHSDEVYLEAWAAAARRVRKLYPYSGQAAAVAAEAIVRSEGPSDERSAELIELSSLMSSGALASLALDFAVYSGAMGDPATALRLPAELFPLLCSRFSGAARERYLVNQAIWTVLKGDNAGAVKQINALFDPALGAVLDNTWQFGAEFFYDHGNFMRSAELFSHFTDDEHLARQADALWLGGYADSAASLWRLVGTTGIHGDTRSRSLYNLASTAPGAAEERAWLERLFADSPAYQDGRVFGLIRYSRLALQDRALAILGRADKDEGLFELEILRRSSESWNVDKTVAETWILVNNRPDDRRILEWAAWYFDYQRRYTETALLLAAAERAGVKENWIAVHRAFALIRDKKAAEAEKLLRDAVPNGRYGGYWEVPANLALILETQRETKAALELYETAAALQAPEVTRLRTLALLRGGEGERAYNETPGALKDASRVQLRIARCLRTLGRDAESGRALDYALDLDGDNIDAVVEKRRLASRI